LNICTAAGEGPIRGLNIPLAKAQSTPRKELIMKENKLRDGSTRIVDRFEQKQ